MRKKLIGLGLAGILALSSSNLSALETNEKGFPIPNKAEAESVRGMKFEFEGGNMMEINQYLGSDGIFFNEVLINNKAAEYVIFKKENEEIDYVLGDNDCNDVFETKYSAEDVLEKRSVPKCYLK